MEGGSFRAVLRWRDRRCYSCGPPYDHFAGDLDLSSPNMLKAHGLSTSGAEALQRQYALLLCDLQTATVRVLPILGRA
jgi:hypothetical protein